LVIESQSSFFSVAKEYTQRDKKHSLPGPQPPNSGPQHCHAAVSEPLLAVCSHQILQNFRRRFAPPNFWDLRTVTLHGNLRFWDLRTVTLCIPLPQSEEGALGLWLCRRAIPFPNSHRLAVRAKHRRRTSAGAASAAAIRAQSHSAAQIIQLNNPLE